MTEWKKEYNYHIDSYKVDADTAIDCELAYKRFHDERDRIRGEEAQRSADYHWGYAEQMYREKFGKDAPTPSCYYMLRGGRDEREPNCENCIYHKYQHKNTYYCGKAVEGRTDND